MGLRTREQFIESLRDGRQVYILGEKVEDVTTHPVLKVTAETVAQDFAITEMDDKEVRDLYVVPHPETGEPMSRYFQTPKTTEDLKRRLEMITKSILLTGGLPFGKDIGTDALNAAMVVAQQMNKPEYVERTGDYLEYLIKNDWTLSGAITDTKGDRSKGPADQAHPDYYLHVVDRNKDGIVVKGCKMHITAAPCCNDIIVLPTRNMQKNEADYAVSFATPSNAKGIKFICRPSRGDRSPNEYPAPLPIRDLNESMIVFDNVFVPWERVFMCGEWPFAILLAYTFATFHRFTAVSYHIPIVENLAGCAVAMAEMNGIADKEHIKDKLINIASYVETIKALAQAATLSPVMYGDIAVPSPLITNMAKLHYARSYHEVIKMVQDISGGIITTLPTYKDWENPETRPDMEHYLGGNPKYTTEERLRMTAHTHRWVASAESAHQEMITVHAEGSMETQKMMIMVEAPFKDYRDLALMAAGVEIKD